MIRTSLLIFFSSIALHSQLVGQELLSLDSLNQLSGVNTIEDYQGDPNKVIKLVLKKKKYQSLPNNLFQFNNLQYLDLSKNKLDTLDPRIGKLSQLQVLILSKNRIPEFPDEIGQLTNLKQLRAGENMLTEINPEIGKLVKLEYLDLWSNDLADMPRTMEDLKNLKEIDFRVNAIKAEDQETIQDYLPKAKMHFSYDCKCY